MALGNVYHVPVAVSLAVILSILAAATAGSLLTDGRSSGSSHAQPVSRPTARRPLVTEATRR